jgi:hypothetical protein
MWQSNTKNISVNWISLSNYRFKKYKNDKYDEFNCWLHKIHNNNNNII